MQDNLLPKNNKSDSSKNKGCGLAYPSEDFVKIAKFCDQTIRSYSNSKHEKYIAIFNHKIFVTLSRGK